MISGPSVVGHMVELVTSGEVVKSMMQPCLPPGQPASAGRCASKRRAPTG
jgi:hypothetical protein